MKNKFKNAGETIVEVLIAVTVLSFTLAISFAMVGNSNKSLIANQEQYQAQQLANQQIEYLRATKAGLDSNNKRQEFKNFDCLVNDGTQIVIMQNNDCKGKSMGGAAIYDIDIQCIVNNGGGNAYGNCSNENKLATYSVTVTWDNIKGGQSRVELQYGM